MDKMGKSSNNILWIIAGSLLLLIPITLFTSNNDANTNGFIVFPYAVCMLILISGDFAADKVVKKGTIFLIADGETKVSIHLWIKDYLRNQCLSGLITVILALLIFHLVVRPLQGYVSSIYNVPWVEILICVLFMTWMSSIFYHFSVALVLKQLRITKLKTYFVYFGFFYSFLDDFNIVNLDHLIFTYVLIGVIMMFATKSKRSKEIARYYEEDLT